MLDNVHAPVATRMCAQCHEPPGSSTPFATRRVGYELCQGCHDDMVRTTLAQNRLHWPVAGADGCASCHNPHASKQANLLKTDTVALCRECHADTSRRIEGTAVKHAPVADGMCGACHSPHGASGVYLMDQPNIQLCGTCHDYQLHSSHPIGETAIDPRNANLHVDCLSCHNGHGTDAKYMLLAPTNVELCTPCHSKISR
jgi:predicted CXXCH cytochrome family protein